MESHLVPPLTNGHSSVHTASNGISSTGSDHSPQTVVKKRKKIPDHVLSISSVASCSSSGQNISESTAAMTQNSNDNFDPPLKKKRGRPTKNSKHPTMQQRSSSTAIVSQTDQPESESIDSTEEQKERASLKSKSHQLQSSRMRGVSSVVKADNPTSSSRSMSTGPSVQQLMARFEDKYNEMGKRYKEMGKIVTQMKVAIEENRDRSEQEIRRELLDEVHKNIIQSFPKR